MSRNFNSSRRTYIPYLQFHKPTFESIFQYQFAIANERSSNDLQSGNANHNCFLENV